MRLAYILHISSAKGGISICVGYLNNMTKGCPTGAINLEFLPREQLAQKFREERATQLRERNA